VGVRAGPADQDHHPEAAHGGEPEERGHPDGAEKRHEANHCSR